jgi:hypothetical protein
LTILADLENIRLELDETLFKLDRNVTEIFKMKEGVFGEHTWGRTQVFK